MRRVLLVIILVLALFALYLLFPRTRVNETTARPAPPPPHAFDRMAGNWWAKYQFDAAGMKGTGYQNADVRHAGRDLSFALVINYVEMRHLGPGIDVPQPVVGHSGFLLSDEGALGYKLGVDSDYGSMEIENLRLAYQAERGFAGDGEGKFLGRKVPVTVSIALNRDGSHVWSVREKADKPEARLRTFYNISFGKAPPPEEPLGGARKKP